MEFYNIWSFVAQRFQDSSILQQLSVLPSNVPLYGYTTFGFPIIRWPTFGCFHHLTIMNNSVMNIQVKVFVRTYVLSSTETKPSSGIVGFTLVRT